MTTDDLADDYRFTDEQHDYLLTHDGEEYVLLKDGVRVRNLRLAAVLALRELAVKKGYLCSDSDLHEAAFSKSRNKEALPATIAERVHGLMSELRRKVGDKSRRVIENEPRHGYRLALPVEVVPRAVEATRERPSPAYRVPRVFAEFFGISADVQEPRGLVFVQSDRLDHLMARVAYEAAEKLAGTKTTEPPTEEVLSLLSDQVRELVYRSIKPLSRFHKARLFSNVWDLEGAEAVRRLFRINKLTPPELILSRHNEKDPSAPFEIAMGLGFTDKTDSILTSREIFGTWLRVARGLPAGDALVLAEELFDATTAALASQPDEEPGFVRLLPQEWGSDYTERWVATLDNKNLAPVRDYAFILRHTSIEAGETHVRFVLAGFTEIGTAIAGAYLEDRLEDLHRRFIVEQDPLSRGDFLLVIAGPSRFEDYEKWGEDPGLPPITPKRLKDAGIPCEWARRLPA